MISEYLFPGVRDIEGKFSYGSHATNIIYVHVMIRRGQCGGWIVCRHLCSTWLLSLLYIILGHWEHLLFSWKAMVGFMIIILASEQVLLPTNTYIQVNFLRDKPNSGKTGIGTVSSILNSCNIIT